MDTEELYAQASRADDKIYTLFFHSCHSGHHKADQAAGHQTSHGPLCSPGNTFNIQHLCSHALLSYSLILPLLCKHNFSLQGIHFYIAKEKIYYLYLVMKNVKFSSQMR